MSRSNADYLVRKTTEFLEEREEECELRVHDAIKLVGQTKTMVLKVSQDTSKTLEMLKTKEREPMDLRHDAILAGLDPNDPTVIAKVKAQRSEAGMGGTTMATGVPVG